MIEKRILCIWRQAVLFAKHFSKIGLGLYWGIFLSVIINIFPLPYGTEESAINYPLACPLIGLGMGLLIVILASDLRQTILFVAISSVGLFAAIRPEENQLSLSALNAAISYALGALIITLIIKLLDAAPSKYDAVCNCLKIKINELRLRRKSTAQAADKLLQAEQRTN